MAKWQNNSIYYTTNWVNKTIKIKYKSVIIIKNEVSNILVYRIMTIWEPENFKYFILFKTSANCSDFFLILSALDLSNHLPHVHIITLFKTVFLIFKW